jgi:hypothetical protein
VDHDAGNPDTFRAAGALGFNVLTHLLGQTLEELADKLQVYREAWREAGHPGDGRRDADAAHLRRRGLDEVREIVQGADEGLPRAAP